MQILQTKDYNQFTFLDHNRNVNQNKLDALIKKIQNNNKLYANPIVVNSLMQVVEGQHRLLAAKHLNVEIFYIVDPYYQAQDIMTFNSLRNNWSTSNYIDSYCTLGKEPYIFLKRIMGLVDDSRAPLSTVIKVVSSLSTGGKQHGFSSMMRDGELEINNRNMIETFIIVTIPKIKEVNKLIFSNNKKNGHGLFYVSSYMGALCSAYKAMNAVQYEELWSCIFRDYTRFVSTTHVHRVMAMFENSYNKRKSATRFDFGKVKMNGSKERNPEDFFTYDDN